MRSPGILITFVIILPCLSLLPSTASADYGMIWQEEVDVSLDFVTRPEESMLGDMDGDGIDEIAAVNPDRQLTIRDGASGAITYETPFDTEVQATCLFDFDDDGTLEVILAGKIAGARCVAIIDHVGPAPLVNDAFSQLPSPALSAQPNPFNPSTLISFTLDAAGRVEVPIFDVNGRLVRLLLRETLTSGKHVVSWDGRDESGQQLVSGHYFCHLVVDGRVWGTQRAVILK